VNDRHAPPDARDAPDAPDAPDAAPDAAVGPAQLDGSEAAIGDVREDAGVDEHGPVHDLLAVGDPPAHLFTAALERAFASSPDEASAELVPHDHGAAAASEQPDVLSDPERPGEVDQSDVDQGDVDQGDADHGDVQSPEDSAHGLRVDDGPGGADGGDGLAEPVGHGAGDGDDGW
jgi:hypothetical protein